MSESTVSVPESWVRLPQAASNRWGPFQSLQSPSLAAQPSLSSPQKARKGEAPFIIKALPTSSQQKLPGARALVLGRKESPAWPCGVQLPGWTQKSPN